MSAPPLYTLHQGDSILLISVPHAGTYLPPELLPRLTASGRAMLDTDWHVDRLYSFAHALGATVLVATHSRTLVDLNRSPQGAPLYPGQAETTICPTETFGGEPLYLEGRPGPAECDERVRLYWQPYHTALKAQLGRILAQHGRAHLLDGHSIRSVIPRLFEGTLPDLNFGTNNGASAEPALIARAMGATAGSGFSQVLDGRFRGGAITRHYGSPAQGVHAVQLELAQSSYMDEAGAPRWDEDRASRLIAALRLLVRELTRA